MHLHSIQPEKAVRSAFVKRVTARFSPEPDVEDRTIGFRCAMDSYEEVVHVAGPSWTLAILIPLNHTGAPWNLFLDHRNGSSFLW